MTFEEAYEYAKGRAEDIEEEEFDSWIEISHKDGSELYFECCFFEFIESNGEDGAWLALWTQNHGYLVYPEDNLISWQGGEMGEDNEESVFLAS